MKRLITSILLSLSLFLGGCSMLSSPSSTDVFNTAVVASSYTEVLNNYDDAKDIVLKTCKTMDKAVCAELKMNIATLDNIKMAVSTLNGKNESAIQKLISLENIRAFYVQGKLAWINIRNILTEHGTLSADDTITLMAYDNQGKMLSEAMTMLIESANEKDPKYVPMLNNIMQIIGLTAKTIALF